MTESDNFTALIFKCHCGEKRVYGSGPISGQTFSQSLRLHSRRPRLYCSGPHANPLQIHTFCGMETQKWVEYREERLSM